MIFFVLSILNKQKKLLKADTDVLVFLLQLLELMLASQTDMQ